MQVSITVMYDEKEISKLEEVFATVKRLQEASIANKPLQASEKEEKTAEHQIPQEPQKPKRRGRPTKKNAETPKEKSEKTPKPTNVPDLNFDNLSEEKFGAMRAFYMADPKHEKIDLPFGRFAASKWIKQFGDEGREFVKDCLTACKVSEFAELTDVRPFLNYLFKLEAIPTQSEEDPDDFSF